MTGGWLAFWRGWSIALAFLLVCHLDQQGLFHTGGGWNQSVEIEVKQIVHALI